MSVVACVLCWPDSSMGSHGGRPSRIFGRREVTAKVRLEDSCSFACAKCRQIRAMSVYDVHHFFTGSKIRRCLLCRVELNKCTCRFDQNRRLD